MLPLQDPFYILFLVIFSIFWKNWSLHFNIRAVFLYLSFTFLPCHFLSVLYFISVLWFSICLVIFNLLVFFCLSCTVFFYVCCTFLSCHFLYVLYFYIFSIFQYVLYFSNCVLLFSVFCFYICFLFFLSVNIEGDKISFPWSQLTSNFASLTESLHYVVVTTINIVVVFVILSAVFQIVEHIFLSLFRLSSAASLPSCSNHRQHQGTVVHVCNISGLRGDQGDLGEQGGGSSEVRGYQFSRTSTLQLSRKIDNLLLSRNDKKQTMNVQFSETNV